jgi:hypothetical protein
MPLDLTCDTDTVLELDEYVELIKQVDLDDRDAVLATAVHLKALSNNRRFLLDRMIEQVMASEQRGTMFEYRYVPNVFVLAHAPKFAVRAVIWPPASQAWTEAQKQIFSFELPHDHNFDFMTVGYDGPGYETELYEYNIAGTIGYPGEYVDLTATGRTRLEPGRILFFRKGIDIHTQLPPAATSISLNLLLDPPTTTPQYVFDVERHTIEKNIHSYPQVTLVELIAPFFGNDIRDRLAPLTEHHPDEQVRLAAYRATATQLGVDAWKVALLDRSELVRRHAALALG